MHFIGCDVSKQSLDLAWTQPDTQAWAKPLKVANQRTGWQILKQRLVQHCATDRSDICVVLEATAVYHLPLATYLSGAGFRVLVCNPGRSAEYARSQNRLNKSDRLDARSLYHYGSNLQKFHWFQADSPQINQLKALLGLLDQLDKDIQRWRNRLEKATYQFTATATVVAIKRQLRNLQREQLRTQAAIDQLVQGDDDLRRNQQLMCTINGVGRKTSQRLLPLLQHQRFESARQLAAFLGLTPCHKSSGTSLKSPARLSGRGNATIRAKLYMPALSAIQHNPELKAFYQRLLARGKTEKQAITAIMRKLVHLCYGVVKNQTPYQEHYAALS